MAKSNKTTQKHFDLFKKEVMKWVNIFGLKEWKIHFEHWDYDYDYKAYIKVNFDARTATFNLNTDYGEPVTNEDIKTTAFHESCELLLVKLSQMAKMRFITLDDIEGETHSIINILQSVLYEKY